jgi:hypothetical protein
MQSFNNDAFEKLLDDFLVDIEELEYAAFINFLHGKDRTWEEYWVDCNLPRDSEGSFVVSPEKLRAAAIQHLEEKFVTYGS